MVVRKASGRAGFTLLELLVALTLLGLVMAALFGELRFAVRAWDGADARLAAAAEASGVRGFVRRQLQQLAVSPMLAGAAAGQPVFEGTAHAMSFLGAMPGVASEGGLDRIVIYAEARGGERRLIVRWTPQVGGTGTGSAAQEGGSRVLLDGCRSIRLSFFGAVGRDRGLGWVDSWPAGKELPQLVRLQVEFGEDDARTWPELVVAPAGATAVAGLP
jgi:general secretion pathway protein J